MYMYHTMYMYIHPVDDDQPEIEHFQSSSSSLYTHVQYMYPNNASFSLLTAIFSIVLPFHVSVSQSIPAAGTSTCRIELTDHKAYMYILPITLLFHQVKGLVFTLENGACQAKCPSFNLNPHTV